MQRTSYICGCVLEEDTLVRLQKRQVYINGREQSAVGVYWVSDGMDRSPPPPPSETSQQTGRCSLSSSTEVYSDNSDSPTKRHKHKKNFGCAIAAIVSSNEPKTDGKGRKGSQSRTTTPTNVDAPPNNNKTSLNCKRSPGCGTENNKSTKNRKLVV